MTLFTISFLAGALTICSPCILPVLPFVLSRTGQPFTRSVLPMLLSLAATFALVATFASTGGSWVIGANEAGRGLALLLLAVFGLTLISSQLATRLAYPFVTLGNQLLGHTNPEKPGIAASILLGVATGLLWAPCAGPILGLILTSAALHGTSTRTAVLLCAYAAGAATSMALAVALSGRVLGWMRQSTRYLEWVRRAIGVAILASVAAITFGWDTGILATSSFANTTALEERLLHQMRRTVQAKDDDNEAAAFTPVSLSIDRSINNANNTPLPVEGKAPDLNGAVAWLNSPALSMEQLKGKVVLVDFWTYSCINCVRTLPYLRAWDQKYKAQGLVVIGVHTPEFAFEKNVNNVQAALRSFRINYPVPIDSDYRVWRAFNNQYWPAMYFIDGKGHIRHHVFGEGDYAESERVIQQLLAEQQNTVQAVHGNPGIDAPGIEAPSDSHDVRSEETYVGYAHAERLASPGGIQANRDHLYTQRILHLNEWAFVGHWTVRSEFAEATTSGAKIVYRFHARDLHLVLGTSNDATPVRFRVTVDGAAPGASHGADTYADGNGVISQTRLYQLVRQTGDIQDRTFQIEFLDPHVCAFAFTFG